MKMLMMRKGRTRADGSTTIVPLLRERAQKYGAIKSESALQIKRDVLITGGHGAGKTRWIQRYVDNAPSIWPGRPVCYLRSVNPLAQWIDQPELAAWVEKKAASAPDNPGKKNGTPADAWNRLKSHERSEKLIEWIAAVGAIVIIDDGHKLTGRKADIAVRAARTARVLIMSTAQEARLPLTIRLAVLHRQPQIVNLTTEASYDITSLLVWVMTLVSLGAGAWPVAAVLGGMNMLGRGQRAARQS
jgi:hypothetical protein